MSSEAVSCTIELSTGSMVEVAMMPKDVIKNREQFWESLELMPLPLLTGTSRPDADYRQEMYVDPHSIVAVYPLDERPIPPRRVYVDRVEAHSRI